MSAMEVQEKFPVTPQVESVLHEKPPKAKYYTTYESNNKLWSGPPGMPGVEPKFVGTGTRLRSLTPSNYKVIVEGKRYSFVEAISGEMIGTRGWWLLERRKKNSNLPHR